MNPSLYIIDDDPESLRLFSAIKLQSAHEGFLGVHFEADLNPRDKALESCVQWCNEQIARSSSDIIVFLLDLKLQLKNGLTQAQETEALTTLGIKYGPGDPMLQGFAVAARVINTTDIPRDKLVVWLIQSVGHDFPVPTIREGLGHVFAAIHSNYPAFSVLATSFASSVDFTGFLAAENSRFAKALKGALKAICSEGEASIAGIVDKHRDYLSSLRRSTARWFSKNIGAGWSSFDSDGPPHRFPGEAEQPADFLPKYALFLKRTFPWFSEKWISESRQAQALHEALKSVVGPYAEWMGTADADRSLSLAGAYFLLCCAMCRSAPSGTALDSFALSDWTAFHRPEAEAYNSNTLYRFLPHQTKEVAETNVRLLYGIFSALAKKQGVESRCGIKGFEEPGSNRPWIRLKLDWDGFSSFSEKAAGMLKAALLPSSDSSFLPDAKFVGLVMRFALASQISKTGFGAYGLLRLETTKNECRNEEYWLRIGGLAP